MLFQEIVPPLIEITADQALDKGLELINSWGFMVFITCTIIIAVMGVMLNRFYHSFDGGN